MNKIIDGCKSLLFFPDITRWNIEKLKNDNNISYNSSKLSILDNSLLDIKINSNNLENNSNFNIAY